MHRKNFTLATESAANTETAAMSPETPGVRSFDFKQPIEAMDAETLNIYYRLRRVALMENDGRGDPDKLPDGKTLTEAQVVAILGPDYLNGLVITKKCCGQT